MDDCPACAKQPGSGETRAGCRNCALRELAQGIPFFDSMRAGRLTREYVKLLRPLGDPKTVHETEVRPLAKRWLRGSLRG